MQEIGTSESIIIEQGQVRKEIEKVTNELSALEDNANDLLNNLKPILIAIPKKEEPEKVQEPELVEIATMIAEILKRIQKLNQVLSSTTERLEL